MKNENKKYLRPGEPGFVNPFLTEERDALWERVEREGVPIPIEEVHKRAEALRKAHEKKQGKQD